MTVDTTYTLHYTSADGPEPDATWSVYREKYLRFGDDEPIDDSQERVSTHPNEAEADAEAKRLQRMVVSRTRTRRVEIPVNPTPQGAKQQFRQGTVIGEIEGTTEGRPVKILRVHMDDNHLVELHEENDTDFCGFRAWLWIDYDSMETPEDCVEALLDYVRSDMSPENDYYVDGTAQDDHKKTSFGFTLRIGPDGRAHATLKERSSV